MKIQIYFYSLLLIVGCAKKDNADVTPVIPPSTNDIVLITTSAIPGEVVLAQANFKPAKDTATILVGGKQTMAVVIESNQIAFFMPELTAGSNVSVQYKNIGVNKELSISIGNYLTIAQPNLIFTAFMTEQDKIIQNLEAYKNDTIIKLNPSYIDAIRYMNQNISIKFASLTADEKKQIAYVLRSNMPMETDFRMEPLNPLFYARNQTEALLPDAEDVAWNKSGRILSEIATGLGLMGQGVAFVAAGMLVSPIPVFGTLVGISAAIAGAALFVKGSELFIHGFGEGDALNKSVLKTDLGIDAESSLEFLKDINRTVTFKGTFRRVIQSDAGSNNVLLKKIYSAIQNINTTLAKMIDGYQRIKLFFLGNPPAIPADNLIVGTQAFSKKIAMQGGKLSLNNVSIPAISVTFVKDDAALTIKATSTTIIVETPFSFNVVYNNPTTGSTVTQTINCLYKPNPDSIELYKAQVIGNWKTTTYSMPSGQLYYTTYETVLANGISQRTSRVDPNGSIETYNPPIEYGWSITGNNTVGYYWVFAGVTSRRLSYPVIEMITEVTGVKNVHTRN